jgi:hypothetical protein
MSPPQVLHNARWFLLLMAFFLFGGTLLMGTVLPMRVNSHGPSISGVDQGKDAPEGGIISLLYSYDIYLQQLLVIMLGGVDGGLFDEIRGHTSEPAACGPHQPPAEPTARCPTARWACQWMGQLPCSRFWGQQHPVARLGR